jgi:hypothetical protein
MDVNPSLPLQHKNGCFFMSPSLQVTECIFLERNPRASFSSRLKILVLGHGKMNEINAAKVTLQKELDEQNQVTAVHEQRRDIVVDTQHARRFVTAEPEYVTAHQCHNDADNHLTDLRHGNVHGLEGFGLDPRGHQKVVPVHDGMDKVVHGAKDNTVRGAGDKTVPTVGED